MTLSHLPFTSFVEAPGEALSGSDNWVLSSLTAPFKARGFGTLKESVWLR